MLRSFACLLLGSTLALAQTDRSAITGTVTDPQNLRIHDALVSARNSATGLDRQTRTSSDGTYILDGLPIGLYTVTFAKDGFQSERFEGVQQSIGATRTLNAKLSLGQTSGSAVVAETIAELETNSAAVGEVFQKAQLTELPLNGRNWSHLTSLVPGAVDTGSSDQRSIRFAGHGLDDNNFTFDGVDASGILNQAQKQFVRLAIPLDAIGEFQVRTQNFNADTGETGGGQISVTSTAGTNQFHGSAFDYLRNNYFDARSPFDSSAPAPFVLNQFGGSAGGAIVENRTFFFTNYEGLRQRRSQTQIGLVPSATFDAQTLARSPALAPVLAAYPQGTSPTSNANVSNYNASAKQVDNEDAGSVRIDHHFSASTTAFLRFTADEADYTIPTGVLSAFQNTDAKIKNGIAEVFHVFSPALVNEFKFGLNQDQFHVATFSGVPFAVKISGLSALNASNTTDGQGTTFNFLDDVTYVKGRHIFKAGVEYRAIRLNQGNSENGTLTYTSLQNFQANSLDNASYTAQLPLKRLRKFKVFAYLQDEYKVTPNLTITAGVRYSFFNVLHELDNRAIPFDLETCGGYCKNTDPFTFPRYNDIDPRLGLAWSRGNTVIRLGAGLYHSDGQEDDQNLPYQNDVQRYTITAAGVPGLGYPIQPFLATATGINTPRDLYRNRKDFYISSWTASIQHAVGNGIVLNAAYAANKGTNILTTTYQNTYYPFTTIRPYPKFGVIEFRKNDSNSTFQSLQLQAQKKFSRGFLFSANYMWSHSINDGGIGGGDSDTIQNVHCRACDRASSDFDVRHVFNATAVYQLPWLLKGWQASGVFTARSGLPVNVTVDRSNNDLPDGYAVSGSERPNLVPGVSLVPPAGQTPTSWINPAAFAVPAPGTWGNAGRNLIRAPRLMQLDTSVSRTFRLKERLQLQFRAEIYNLFNRAQYASPLANISVPANLGVITAPVNQGATGGGTPRQFQFALKLMF